jgi:hypothetical protein
MLLILHTSPTAIDLEEERRTLLLPSAPTDSVGRHKLQCPKFSGAACGFPAVEERHAVRPPRARISLYCGVALSGIVLAFVTKAQTGKLTRPSTLDLTPSMPRSISPCTTSTCTMNANSSPASNAPSRILIRTTLSDLRRHHSSIQRASNLIIQQFSIHTLHTAETAALRYLITRIADKSNGRKQRRRHSRQDEEGHEKATNHNGKRREPQRAVVDIVFDHNVTDSSSQPDVLAYRYSYAPLAMFTELRHPEIGKRVNAWMKHYSEINSNHNLEFPRVSDVRAETRRSRRTHTLTSSPSSALAN